MEISAKTRESKGGKVQDPTTSACGDIQDHKDGASIGDPLGELSLCNFFYLNTEWKSSTTDMLCLKLNNCFKWTICQVFLVPSFKDNFGTL